MSCDEAKMVEKYTAEYMQFLNASKTERRAFSEAVKLLEKNGFKEISKAKKLRPGDKVWRGYHGKTLMASVIGKDAITSGLKIVGGHTDAPRLDLKPRPIYEKGYMTFFDTHMYGGIKKYQWLALPLALYGTVVKKDGKSVDVSIGDEETDPVFMISDILPHFGKDQMERKASDVVSAEDMDVFAGIGKDEAIFKIFKKKYGIDKDDFLSAELEIVPAGKAREVGLDRSMIASYGHDDRVCAYAGLSALIDVAKAKTPPAKTIMVLLCDKEEIGSVGATGMESTFFENSVAELIDRVEGKVGMLDLRRTLEASQMLSADVCAASDPHYGDADSIGNAAQAGKGPCAIKYTGAANKGSASDARAEFVAKLRKLLDSEKIVWQMGELGRAEKGGGGTIAKCMARYGMDVIDFGTPLLNMHAPWELASKTDCWNTMRAYKAFFESSL
jgi:aspartyl aminopeptidase